MWNTQIDLLNEGQGQRFTVFHDAKPVSFADVLAMWRNDSKFRAFFVSLLAESPFVTYRWETPCVTASTLSRDFEFVLLRCDSLERSVDPIAFKSQFCNESEVVTFPNLGGDAVLVVPCPGFDQEIYGHLASFVRHAPESQRHQLWRSVANAMFERVSDRPTWLSTAGMGVSWLHVRLDDRPKYYGYAAYR